MLYVVALKLDLALFTVYPSIGVVLLGTHHSRDHVGPRWIAFSRDVLVRLDRHGRARSADIRPWRRTLARALVTTVLVGWLWVLPVAAMIGCVYLTLPWFRL